MRAVFSKILVYAKKNLGIKIEKTARETSASKGYGKERYDNAWSPSKMNNGIDVG